jgi:hypothetical protein
MGSRQGVYKVSKQPDDTYSQDEARKRFEAALRGARVVGHKLQSEMKLGKPRGKPSKSPAKRKEKKPGR